jgi:glycosyltransferase involved in cell wall biosynthesis
MKILLVGDYGVIHTRRYLDLILKAGCEVAILNTGRRTIHMDEVPAEQHYNWPRSGRHLTSYLFGSRLANKLGDFLVSLQLRRLWFNTHPDITHVQWIDEKAWLIANAGISPLVVTAWGSDLNMTQDRTYDPILLRRVAEVIRKTALLIADSQDMINIANRLAMSSVRSALLPIGIDTKLFRPGAKAEAFERRRKLNIPDTAKVVLSPRAFRQTYCHDSILRAFAGAVKSADIDAYLVFKAYDCWDRSYIDRIIGIATECDISDRIRIIEEMSYAQLPIYYAMGDFAVNFPVMDAFPVAFLECLACELPVLTKHLPAYDSLGIAPYLRFTDAPSERSLEASISMMLSLSGRPDMSQARAYVSANFDESVVARTLGDAYQRVRNAGVGTP